MYKLFWPILSVLLVALPIHARSINEALARQLHHIINSSDITIVMRHGEQEKSPHVIALENPALEKIAMMRQEENMQNPLTKRSIEEAVMLSEQLKIMQRTTHKPFYIETSQNERARQVAAIIASTLNIPYEVDATWTCINYPDGKTTELLSLLPEGTLPWEKAIVDHIIGADTFDTLTTNACNAATPYSDSVKIIITHTQQISAIASSYGISIDRLGYFGFIAISAEGNVTVFPNGLFE